MIEEESGSMGLSAGWTISIEEVSAGVYLLIAKDLAGHTIRRSGTDPDAMLEDCRADIAELIGNQSRP